MSVGGKCPSTFTFGSTYPIALVASSTNANAAAFLAYLRSPVALRIYGAKGFTVLK